MRLAGFKDILVGIALICGLAWAGMAVAHGMSGARAPRDRIVHVAGPAHWPPASRPVRACRPPALPLC